MCKAVPSSGPHTSGLHETLPYNGRCRATIVGRNQKEVMGTWVSWQGSMDGWIMAAAAVAAVALIISIFTLLLTLRWRRRVNSSLQRNGNARLVEAVDAVATAVREMQSLLENQGARLDHLQRHSIQSLSLQRFAAFSPGPSAPSSFTIAAIDGEASGVTITVIQAGDGSYVYGKGIRKGQSEVRLSDEEAAALEVAEDALKAHRQH